MNTTGSLIRALAVAKMINVRFNRELWTLEHICDNPECGINTLPLMIVDSEVFRYLPSCGKCRRQDGSIRYDE